MNFSAALAERIQLKFFGAQVLPGWLVFGVLPRSHVITTSSCLLRARAAAG